MSHTSLASRYRAPIQQSDLAGMAVVPEAEVVASGPIRPVMRPSPVCGPSASELGFGSCEHSGRGGSAELTHSSQHEEHNSAVEGVSTAANEHLGYEAVVGGGHRIKDLPKHALKVLQGTGSKADIVGTYAGLIANPLEIGVGIHEIVEAVQQYGHDTEGGIATGIKGVLSVASGSGGLMASAGWINPAWGLGAASGKAGFEIGRYSDKRAKELGVFEDAYGRAETGSQWAADRGIAAEDWMRKHARNETLAKLAGGTATLANATFVAAPVAVGAAAADALVTVGSAAADIGTAVGTRAARSQRAARYAGLTMNGDAPVIDRIGIRDPKTSEVTFETADAAGRMRAAERMAVEDEKREEAIARSKLLYPERWGIAPNPVSIVHHTAMAAKAGGAQ